MAEKCKVTVYPRERFGSFHGLPCDRTAKIEKDGKWYCGIHDPQKKIDKREKWRQQNEREQAVREHAANLQQARQAVIDAARDWSHAIVGLREVNRLHEAVRRLEEMEGK